jgi:hypothetical protein
MKYHYVPIRWQILSKSLIKHSWPSKLMDSTLMDSINLRLGNIWEKNLSECVQTFFLSFPQKY